MTAAQFRKLALGLPQAVEVGHMGHPDFRVGGKIFATLGYPDDEWGMVKLTPDQQARLFEAAPAVFVPVKGIWGRRGATSVYLNKVKATELRRALLVAWRNTAPKRMVQQFDADN